MAILDDLPVWLIVVIIIVAFIGLSMIFACCGCVGKDNAKGSGGQSHYNYDGGENGRYYGGGGDYGGGGGGDCGGDSGGGGGD